MYLTQAAQTFDGVGATSSSDPLDDILVSSSDVRMSLLEMEARMATLLRDMVVQQLYAFLGGMRDFALAADGGSVACPLTSGCYVSAYLSLWNSPVLAITEDPRIRMCWFQSTSSFQLGLLLAKPVSPSFITTEHTPRAIAADIGQAQRVMVLWGLVDGPGNEKRVGGISKSYLDGVLPFKDRQAPPLPLRFRYVPIAVFEYDIWADVHLQTFPVLDYVKTASLDFSVVILEVVSNWGSDGTCLYRVRLHGVEIAESL